MNFPPVTPRGLAARLSIGIFLPLAAPALATDVTMHTPFGEVEIELFDEAAPVTVANFLQYVNDGSYANSFIHRSDPGFVIQGGGYYFDDGSPIAIATRAPIANEAGISNDRGTLAMAKKMNDPDSATSQWFFNLENNAAELDDDNGGYTVFGRVLGDGMDVIDQIADLKVWNAGAPFNELPLIDYPGTPTPVTDQHLVMIEIEVDSTFMINPGLNDTWYYPGTDGQGFFIIVYPEIQSMFLSWFTFDTERPDGSVTAVLGDPGHRWLTAQGSYAGNEATLDVYITSGGVFDSGTPAPVPGPDGTIVVEFSGCNEGTVTYDIPSIDRQGVVPIERVFVDSDNLAYCEALSGSGEEAP
jgi:peptidyl-prolyl cis-trans isomerase A (cyclophilin A)